MDTIKTSETIDTDRRRLLGTAALGIAAFSAANLLPSELTAAPANDAIRPFPGVHVPEDALVDLRRRISRPVGPIGRRSAIVPGRTALDNPGTRALLGERV